MGTEITQAQITRLEESKVAIATAIENKGVAVPNGTKVDGFAPLIEQITAGGSPNGRQWTLSSNDSGTALGYHLGEWTVGSTYDADAVPIYTEYHAPTGISVKAETGLYYSTDRGSTWVQSNITSGTFCTVYNDHGIWVAGGTTGLYYSVDGQTWVQSNVIENALHVYNMDGVWAALTDSGIYTSISWEFEE